jgi:crotonobetainyl-CoA:carnitine CoA-transferase CaiB-like acyl-CoA transferase
VLIGANQDSVFRRLADAMGTPALASDPRYATHAARGARQAELDALINDWTAEQSVSAVLARMEQFSVPAGRVFSAPDMVADPHYAAREALVKVAHPEFANLVMQNVIPKLSETPGGVAWAGPAMGAHNRDIYQGLLGLSDDDLMGLESEGII